MAKNIGYHIEGSYYEACNCNAICPCRRQNGKAGGLSDYGNCDFLLSWNIKSGHFEKLDLSGLTVCMAGTYSDDEDGSPWTVFIYISDAASEPQFNALSEIFQGKAGGDILFTGNISTVLGIRSTPIRLVHTPGQETIQVGATASAKVAKVYEFDGTVSCGIPGHDHPGQENVSSLRVDDGALNFDYEERCGFSTEFAYGS